MAFVVQDDDGDVGGANALITVAYFREYHRDRNNDLGIKTDEEIQSAIISATDYLGSRWKFRGTPLSSTTSWPRNCVVDANGETVEGIPVAIQQAVAEYALYALSASLTVNPALDASGRLISKIRKEVVGGVVKDVTYDVSKGQQFQAVPAADQRLKFSGLLRATSSSSLMRG
jgi:hypothetical protein